MRRQVLVRLANAATMLAATALLLAAPARAQDDTIKVGLLMSYSGIGMLGGTSADNVIKQFQARHGTAPGGKRIEFIRRDTTGPNPEVARRMAQELLAREKVQIVLGPDFTPNVLTLAPLFTEAKVPAIITGAATHGIVGEKSPYYLRTFFSIPQLVRPMAQWARKSGLQKVVVVVADYGPGHDAEATFGKSFGEQGGTVLSSIRVPIRNPEFSSTMQRIRDAKAEAVFVFMPLGEVALQFMKAYNDSGLKSTGIKLLATADITDESTLAAAGDGALDIVTTGVYAPSHDSPLNKAFVAEHEKMFGKSPRLSLIHATVWDAMQILYSGLEAQKGQRFDPDKFIAHARGRSFESPRGPVTVDPANGDLVQNVYLRRTEKRDGVVQNIEFDVIKAVPTN
jgi:branched-chain amino acid transport system substrate-binding protein